MIKNTWRTIRLCYESAAHLPSFRFGATIIPVFNKHVAMREQFEAMSKVAPRSNGPIPLERLLVFGGIALDDYEAIMADGEDAQQQQTDAFQGS